MIMLSLLCSANKLKTASLFRNIKHLSVSEADTRQLEKQTVRNLLAAVPAQKVRADYELVLGQLFFLNFTTTIHTSPPKDGDHIFAPDWIARIDDDIQKANGHETSKVEQAFQKLFDTLVVMFQSAGQTRQSAIDRATTEAHYHYQWMLMNLVLPAMIDENLQTEILNSKAPLYSEFRRQNAFENSREHTYPKEFIFLTVPLALYLCRGAQKNQPSPMSLIYDLNMHSFPSAQDAIQDIFKRTGIVLNQPQLHMNTAKMPIWVFLVNEMEQQDGRCLIGSLGSYILCDTIIGMLISDPDTYWHQAGSDAGRWSPDDGSLKRPVDTLEKLLAL